MTLVITSSHRFREHKAELERRFRELGPVVAREAGEAAKEQAQLLAAARIEHPSVFGGYLDAFEVEATVTSGRRVRFVLRNVAPHAPYVEDGRPAGQPVMKTYKDNAENRRRGRVGGSYVSHYTGMPPANIFGDGEPTWARRNKIARDGTPGRFIFRDLPGRVDAVATAEAIRRRSAPLLFGR